MEIINCISPLHSLWVWHPRWCKFLNLSPHDYCWLPTGAPQIIYTIIWYGCGHFTVSPPLISACKLAQDSSLQLLHILILIGINATLKSMDSKKFHFMSYPDITFMQRLLDSTSPFHPYHTAISTSTLEILLQVDYISSLLSQKHRWFQYKSGEH